MEGDENDLEALVERAEAYLIEEMYDEGEEEGYDRMTRKQEGGGDTSVSDDVVFVFQVYIRLKYTRNLLFKSAAEEY